MWFLRKTLVEKEALHVSGEQWFNITALPATLSPIIQTGKEIDIRRELAGYVVLIHFWDYTCIACLHALPYLQAWWKRYEKRKFLILGVHTPEFEFAKDADKVESAVLRLGVTYPIVSDPAYNTWKRYHTHAWPRTLIIDAQGIVRYDRSGEGGYEEAEKMIQALLFEADRKKSDTSLLSPLLLEDASGAVCYPTTPKLYLGLKKGGPVNQEGNKKADSFFYRLPPTIPMHTWALEGSWRVGEEDIAPGRDGVGGLGSRFLFHYEATEVFAVMRSLDGGQLSVEIRQDDVFLPEEHRGLDVQKRNGKSVVLVQEDRLYRLVKNPRHGGHMVELLVPPGVALHVVSFGSRCIEEK